MIEGIKIIDYNVLHFLNGSDSILMDGIMVGITSPWTWVALYLALFLLVLKNNQRASQVLLIVACALLCVLLSSTISNDLVKPATCRLRPYVDPNISMWVDTVDGISESSYSFFSAHAANTFSLFVFFMLLVRSRMLSLCLLAWSLLNCYSRVYLGVHFPSDILVGIICGALTGAFSYLVFYFIFRRIYSDYNYISTHYTSTGYGQVDISIVLLIFALTLAYVFLRAVFECRII